MQLSCSRNRLCSALGVDCRIEGSGFRVVAIWVVQVVSRKSLGLELQQSGVPDGKARYRV